MKKAFALLAGLLLLGGCANSNISPTKQNDTTVITTSNQTTDNGGNVTNDDFYVIGLIDTDWNYFYKNKAMKINFTGDELVIETKKSSETYYSALNYIITNDKDNNEITLTYRYNRIGSNWDFFDGSIDNCDAGWFDGGKVIVKFSNDWENLVSYENYKGSCKQDGLVLYQKWIYEYDSKNRLIMQDHYWINEETLKLEYRDKETYEYGSDSLDPTTKVCYGFELLNGEWANKKKEIRYLNIGYDTEGITSMEYKWSTESNDWVPERKTVNEYDEGKIVNREYIWSVEANDWVR